MIKLVVGIDPGESGAVAIITMEGGKQHVLRAGKHTLYDIGQHLFSIRGDVVCAYLEQVGVRPEQGISSAAKFMINYGEYRGLLAGLSIPVKHVLPQVWQRNMRCLTRGDKNVTKRKAQELYPTMTITHADADALLIAEYGRRQEIGLINRDPAQDV